MTPPRDITTIKTAVRTRVCTRCNREPADAAGARPCEDACTIFTNLVVLRAIAESLPDATESRYRVAINRLICNSCTQRRPLGDACQNQAAGSCPLSLYAEDVAGAIEAAA
jgi:hypothetical protein